LGGRQLLPIRYAPFFFGHAREAREGQCPDRYAFGNEVQHINGICHLYAALSIFKTGRIRHKGGSNATFVFVIDNRVSLEDKVIPFFESYVVPYASFEKVERMQTFKKKMLNVLLTLKLMVNLCFQIMGLSPEGRLVC
jgi:hypothetical protein